MHAGRPVAGQYEDGAHEQNRTADPLLTMEVLYLLSYAGP